MVPPAVVDRRAFWRGRRRIYNVALLISGALAALVFVAVLVAWGLWPPPPEQFEHADFDLLALILAPVAYALAMGVANVLYLLGPLAEILVRPSRPDRFRRWIFTAGLIFSVLLPWAVPCNAWYEFLRVTLHR